MDHVPISLDLFFALTTIVAIALFLRAMHARRVAAIALLLWMALIALLAAKGFFLVTTGVPPRFALTIGLPLLATGLLFVLSNGRRFLDTLDPAALTLLSVVRVPVELTLYGLFVHGAVPELMTFSGRNWDILSGITAPLVWYFGYRRNILPRWALVAWNIGCLALLVNIVTNAILAAPFAFQQQAFDRPNTGVLYFPYVWLPAIVVPLVLLSHLVLLRQLLTRKVHRSKLAGPASTSTLPTTA